MAIENRNLEPGTRLTASDKKTSYVCEVGKDEEGKLTFTVDGKEFKSPSSAASHIIGGAANGWRFWSVEGAAPTPATAPTRTRTKADSASKTKKAERKPKARTKAPLKLIRPHENQEDVPEGQVRYWCGACLDLFLGFADVAPEQCPAGHRIDDPELTAPAGVTADAAAEEAATE